MDVDLYDLEPEEAGSTSRTRRGLSTSRSRRSRRITPSCSMGGVFHRRNLIETWIAYKARQGSRSRGAAGRIRTSFFLYYDV